VGAVQAADGAPAAQAADAVATGEDDGPDARKKIRGLLNAS
jgi:hypothetical protein